MLSSTEFQFGPIVQCGIYFLQIGEQEWWYYTKGEDLFVCSHYVHCSSDQNVIQFRIWSAKIK